MHNFPYLDWYVVIENGKLTAPSELEYFETRQNPAECPCNQRAVYPALVEDNEYHQGEGNAKVKDNSFDLGEISRKGNIRYG